MNQPNTQTPEGPRVTLVFCRPGVDPEVITEQLGLAPSVSQRQGASDVYAGRPDSPSSVGVWKHELSNPGRQTVEEELHRWLELLEPRAEALARLRQLGYEPYLDCPYDPIHLSVCLEPEIMHRLAALGLALCVWAYPENEA